MSLKYEVARSTEFEFVSCLRHGGFHKIGGPARVYKTGSMFWFEYDLSHRLDGPADMFSSGTRCYFIRGIEYPKEKYESKIRSSSAKYSH